MKQLKIKIKYAFYIFLNILTNIMNCSIRKDQQWWAMCKASGKETETHWFHKSSKRAILLFSRTSLKNESSTQVVNIVSKKWNSKGALLFLLITPSTDFKHNKNVFMYIYVFDLSHFYLIPSFFLCFVFHNSWLFASLDNSLLILANHCLLRFNQIHRKFVICDL